MLMHILYFLLLVAPCVMSHAPLLNVGYKYMQVCDNKVAASIPGGIDAVMEMGRKYMDYLHNHSNRESIGGFHGGWKHELWRISRPVFAPNCPNLRTFSVHDYDLMKKFCWTTGDDEECSMYSIGSNNQWDFEEDLYKVTKCKTHTFDCTVASPRVPPTIADRTSYHSVCIGQKTFRDSKGRSFMTYKDLLNLTGHQETGVDYFKMDVEGFEWGILTDMVSQAEAEGYDHPLPDQLGVEFHLNMGGSEVLRGAYVSDKLFHFLNLLFLKGGYMIVDMWPNRMDTRCAEVVLIRLFCPFHY